MSIVLLALAMFVLMAYSLSVDEASAVMFEDSSRIDLKNMHNAIADDGNCDGTLNLCDHFSQIYGGKFKFNCTTIGSSAPYNYTVSITSKDLDFKGNLTYAVECPVAGPEVICNDGIDNDGDGDTDCADADCNGQDGGGFVCEHPNELTCDDLNDNDGDGLTDGADPDCAGA